MIQRAIHITAVRQLLRQFPVVGLLGPRQIGKTTLAGQVARRMGGPVSRFDLERDADLAQLKDPELALGPLKGLIVLDEIQERPDLFRSLRVLADRPGRPARFLVLGSASPVLLQQASETLAGRIGYYELPGFGPREIGTRMVDRLWFRGGFPNSFLARTDAASREWLRQFTATFVERDVLRVEPGLPAATLKRFWAMLAHYHGQTWNGAEFARAFGVSESTVRRYLDALASTFVVRILPAWHENLGKRQVKAPKVYLADTGILHHLLGIPDPTGLAAHPKIGASWEGFGLVAAAAALGARPEECFYWATYAGAELDLLVVRGRERIGVEMKRTAAPQLTPSMHIAMKDLRLERLIVLHAGPSRFMMAPRISAIPLRQLAMRHTLEA